MSQILATTQARRVFHSHAIAAHLDQDTLDALANQYGLDDLHARRARTAPSIHNPCRKCRERPCICGERVFAPRSEQVYHVQ